MSRAQIVFMLEELSMKAFLDELLPRLFPSLDYRLIPHRGKTDLERSLPRKLRAWQNPAARFMVVRDQDAGDCVAAKERLQRIAHAAGRRDVVVRIACHELESWLLGDLCAVAEAFQKPGLGNLVRRKKYRDPDHLSSPAAILEDLLGSYQKMSGARRVAAHIDRARNQSRSFHVFVDAVQALATGLDG